MTKKLNINNDVQFGRKELDQIVNDGWHNNYTKQGSAGMDKATVVSHGGDVIMREQELKSIYRSDGFGKKIVNRPTDDMVREWFTVKGDTDGLINKELNVESSENLYKIKYFVLLLLGSKTFEDVSSLKGKLELKDELEAGINNFLKSGKIKVYYSEFVYQLGSLESVAEEEI